ncbi:MAG TPA: NAD(P)-dependent oxidoreductase [Gemmatimonadales bacterium]|nr:NAD(P)-dependent oxidoreductase [Gemmatimonadales bacterium]
MRIFVAGATGAVGRRLVPLLVAAGHDVTAIGRSPGKRAALSRAGARPVEVSLFDREALTRSMAGHQAVINVATSIPPSAARMMLPGAWRENHRIRREGSANLAHAARAAGAERYIQESFAPIYVDGGDRWLDESTPKRTARYNRTVLDAERAAAEFTAAGGVGIVVRFAAFYAADAFQVRDAVRLIRKGWAPLPGSPDAFFSSIHHDDAASAVVSALRARAGAYNVSDDEPLRRREYVDVLAAAIGAPPPRLLPAWLTRWGGSLIELLSRSLRISNRKLREETGWAPAFPSVREGWPAVVRLLHQR